MARVVHIISKGTPAKTQVLLDDGTILEGVSGIDWSLSVNMEIAHVTLTLVGDIHIDVIGEEP